MEGPPMAGGPSLMPHRAAGCYVMLGPGAGGVYPGRVHRGTRPRPVYHWSRSGTDWSRPRPLASASTVIYTVRPSHQL